MDKRLEKIAKIIGRADTIIDIGTDHGYLPLFLLEEGIVSKAIVSDISAASLKKAENLAQEKQMGARMEARLGGGFSVITEEDQLDLAVIAGMGGNLISAIIEEDLSLLKTKPIRLILQPMQNPEVLRQYILDKRFTILSENLVREEKFIYQIIEVSVAENQSHDCYSEAELEFGKKASYKEAEWDLYCELLRNKKRNLQGIMNKIHKSKADNKTSLIEEYQLKIRLLEEMICS